MTIRPVYSKFVLPSQKSLEIIINKKNKKIKIIIIIIIIIIQNGECPLIRVCSLIRSNTVYIIFVQNKFQSHTHALIVQ